MAERTNDRRRKQMNIATAPYRVKTGLVYLTAQSRRPTPFRHDVVMWSDECCKAGVVLLGPELKFCVFVCRDLTNHITNTKTIQLMFRVGYNHNSVNSRNLFRQSSAWFLTNIKPLARLWARASEEISVQDLQQSIFPFADSYNGQFYGYSWSDVIWLSDIKPVTSTRLPDSYTLWLMNIDINKLLKHFKLFFVV